jgi:hypothetical protein
MSLLTISAELPNVDTVLSRLNKAGQPGSLPYTREAVREATRDLIQRTWVQYASGAQVSYSGGTFRVNTVTGSYIRSIQDGLRFPGDLTGEVFTTSYHGELIEDGQPARDMKAKMLSSPKAKTGKDGKRYITVPFRHGTPGTVGLPSMPQHVYAQAKNLQYSRRNEGLGTSKYTWGGKYKDSAPRDAQDGMRTHITPHPGAGYQHKTGIFNGMVRTGKLGHTQYMTFRRLSENSDPKSWMYPAVKPRPIREAVVENTREEVLALVRSGFEMDLYFMGLGGG